MHQSSSSLRQLFALVCLPAIVISIAVRMDASEPPSTVALQELVNGLKTELRIDTVVSAAIVTRNSLLVSVQPVDGDPGTFRMEFEEGFLPSLDQDELKAVIAHELGHVWIYTHHPYLQTERRASTVACVSCHAQASNEPTVGLGTSGAPQATSRASSDQSKRRLVRPTCASTS